MGYILELLEQFTKETSSSPFYLMMSKKMAYEELDACFKLCSK